MKDVNGELLKYEYARTYVRTIRECTYSRCSSLSVHQTQFTESSSITGVLKNLLTDTIIIPFKYYKSAAKGVHYVVNCDRISRNLGLFQDYFAVKIGGQQYGDIDADKNRWMSNII